MKRIICGIVALASTIIFSYYTYYFIGRTEVEGNLGYAIMFFTFTLVTFAATMVCGFWIFNSKSAAKMKELNERVNRWNDFSYHVSSAGDESINGLPVGVISYDDNYQIMWANPYAKEVFQSELVNHPLSTISSKLVSEIGDTSNSDEKFIFKFADKYFEVKHSLEHPVLYFFDITERQNLTNEYNAHISALGIIGIDNLDVSLKAFDMSEKNNIRGQILSEISDWATKYNCYLQSLSDDRMIIMMNKEALLKMIDDKLDVLSKVREICQKVKIKSSLSIGIACYDIELDELGTIAQSAIELAERRGGDQAVVNVQGENIKFFGGSTNTVEKNTLVEARMQTNALKEAIEASSNVIIMCHDLADCDAIGSMLAVLHLVMSSNKDVKMAFDPAKADVTVNRIYKELGSNHALMEKFVSLNQALDLLKENTLLIITDTQSPKLVMFPELLAKATRVSVIDHHRAGDDGYKDTISYYVESSASSTVELVSEMYMFYNDNIEVSSLEASVMLAGIVVDTNNFTYRSGTRTFDAASTLKGMGADMAFVRKLLREPMIVEKQFAQAFMKTTMVADRFAFVCLDEDDIVEDRTRLAKISDKLLTVDGVDVSFTIGKLPDGAIGVSARSLGNVNVQIIMEEIGGGGHYNSAACQLHNTTIENVYKQLCEIVKRDYTNGGDEKVKVILTADVKGKGKKNDVIEVTNGYANFLITNKQAVSATNENLQNLAKEQEQEKINEENRRNVLKKLRDEIQGKFITIQIKVGQDGKLYGHVTTKLVCDEFEAQTGIRLDKRKVELLSDINSVGIFKATVKLESDIVATFEINVEEKK